MNLLNKLSSSRTLVMFLVLATLGGCVSSTRVVNSPRKLEQVITYDKYNLNVEFPESMSAEEREAEIRILEENIPDQVQKIVDDRYRLIYVKGKFTENPLFVEALKKDLKGRTSEIRKHMKIADRLKGKHFPDSKQIFWRAGVYKKDPIHSDAHEIAHAIHTILYYSNYLKERTYPSLFKGYYVAFVKNLKNQGIDPARKAYQKKEVFADLLGGLYSGQLEGALSKEPYTFNLNGKKYSGAQMAEWIEEDVLNRIYSRQDEFKLTNSPTSKSQK